MSTSIAAGVGHYPILLTIPVEVMLVHFKCEMVTMLVSLPLVEHCVSLLFISIV